MPQKRDGRTRVYRRRNVRFARNCILEVDNFGGRRVMIWGTISYARQTQLVQIPGNLSVARYWNEVFTPHMLLAMNLHREVLQHDNALPHTARATVDFLATQNATVLPLPFKSSDWNPTEHLWDDSDHASTVVDQRHKILSRLLSKIGGEFRKNVFVDWSSLWLDGSVLCYRLMGEQQILLWSDVIWALWSLMW